MTAVALIVGILIGFYLAQRRERHDPDLPGLVDVCTVAAPGVDPVWWLPNPTNPALRRLDGVWTTWRESARRRSET